MAMQFPRTDTPFVIYYDNILSGNECISICEVSSPLRVSSFFFFFGGSTLLTPDLFFKRPRVLMLGHRRWSKWKLKECRTTIALWCCSLCSISLVHLFFSFLFSLLFVAIFLDSLPLRLCVCASASHCLQSSILNRSKSKRERSN